MVSQHGLLISEPVLLDVFPKGAEPVSLETYRLVKKAWDLFQLDLSDDFKKTATTQSDSRRRYRNWLNVVFESVLGFSSRHFKNSSQLPEGVCHYLYEYGQELKPDRVLVDDSGTPLLLVKIVSPKVRLEKPEGGKGTWKASPYFKLTTLCLQTGIPFGLVTNGTEFRLIHVQPTTGTAFFEWNAEDWMSEKNLLDSFHTLAGSNRFFGEESARLQRLVDESSKRQLEVTEQLGTQLHDALWLFIRSVGRLPDEHLKRFFGEKSGEYLYDMALTVMMRLVFILYAEENMLLPHGNYLYEKSYGLSHLIFELQSRGAVDERYLSRYDAWPRILSLFRLIWGGCSHPEVGTIGYDSELFDPGRFPELEDPHLQISNETMWRILQHLCFAEAKTGNTKTRQRVSFRTIDVEQIGSVYESLMGYSVQRAEEQMVVFSGKEQHIHAVSEFVDLSGEKLVDFIKNSTGKTAKGIEKILGEHNTGSVWQSWIASFSVEDGVIEPGGLYITRAGRIRKSSGTYYTPKEITRFLVQQALEPLVYEYQEDYKKIRLPREILDLNVCDPSMGSGAFLVQAIRYLGDRLVESWTNAASQTEDGRITLPYGDIPSGDEREELLSDDEVERVQRARLYVAQHCIYGVDLNSMAVELAKISVWLTTMCRDRPLTFMNHRLKCGNSLIGTDSEHVVSIPDEVVWKSDKKSNKAAMQTKTLQGIDFSSYLKEVVGVRHGLNRRELSADDVRAKDSEFRRIEGYDSLIGRLKEVYDLWTALWFWPFEEKSKRNSSSVNGQQQTLFGGSFPKSQIKESVSAGGLFDLAPPHTGVFREFALQLLGGASVQSGEIYVKRYHHHAVSLKKKHRFFHWELEFPEVFYSSEGKRKVNPGFDAVIGNPPWEVIEPKTQEFFVNYCPKFRKLKKDQANEKIKYLLKNENIKIKWHSICKEFENTSRFLKKSCCYPNQLSIVDGKIYRPGLDSFYFFVEKSYFLLKNFGFSSLILPQGIYNNQGGKGIRKLLFDCCEIKKFAGFINSKKIFPIHSSKKFSCLTYKKGNRTNVFSAKFMMELPSELINDDFIDYPANLVKLFSPDFLIILEIKNQTDLFISEKVLSQFIFLNENLQDENWNIDFLSEEFNASRIRIHVTENPEDVPLLEGKNIHQFISNYSIVSNWIKEDYSYSVLKEKELKRQNKYLRSINKKIKNNYQPKSISLHKDFYRLAWRKVASNTNERSFICTILPKNVYVVDSLHTSIPYNYKIFGNEFALIIEPKYPELIFIVTLFNSFILDYIMRIKTSENLNVFAVKELKIPRYSIGNWFFDQISIRGLLLICNENRFKELWKEFVKCYGEKFVNLIKDTLDSDLFEQSLTWSKVVEINGFTQDKRDVGERRQIRAEIDALVAHLYKISKDEFSYILDTFKVLKKNEEVLFGEFISKRKCLEEFDRLESIIDQKNERN